MPGDSNAMKDEVFIELIKGEPEPDIACSCAANGAASGHNPHCAMWSEEDG